MKLPEKWTKLELEAFHSNDAVSVAIKLLQLIDYLEENQWQRNSDSSTPYERGYKQGKFDAETVEIVDRGRAYKLPYRVSVYTANKEAAEQAREVLLKLTDTHRTTANGTGVDNFTATH